MVGPLNNEKNKFLAPPLTVFDALLQELVVDLC